VATLSLYVDGEKNLDRTLLVGPVLAARFMLPELGRDRDAGRTHHLNATIAQGSPSRSTA
jgi:hypothetical protein